MTDTKNTYRIYSKQGDDYGAFKGETPAEAFLEMLHDAGYGPDVVTLTSDGTDVDFGTNSNAARAAGHINDWTIEMV